MNISKNIAVLTTMALVAGSIPFMGSTSAYNNKQETTHKIMKMDSEKHIEGIGSLQYLQGNTWTDIKENAYYSKSVQFRFTVNTEKIKLQNITAYVFADDKAISIIDFSGTDNNTKVLEKGNYREYYFQLDQDRLTAVHKLEVSLNINESVLTEEVEEDSSKTEQTDEGSETEIEETPYIHISFPKIYIEARIPELVLASDYVSDTWTSEDVVVNLSNMQENQKAQTIFYVKKIGESNYKEIEDTDLETIVDSNGSKQYLYHIRDSVKGSYYFKAGYVLTDSRQSNLSKEQKIDVQIDKALPQVKVSQSMQEWTNKEVVFTLSNLGKNISDITYYVKHNNEEWEQIKTSQYTVLEEENGGRYQFKAVSAVGEEGSIYKNVQQKSWISEEYKVYIDKQKPKENKVNIERKAKDTGTGEWYSKVPSITLDVTQDEGSKVSGYYRLYAEEEERNYNLYEEGKDLAIKEDGRYILETYAEDEAGNQSDVIYKKINVDTTKPEITNIQFTDLNGKQLEPKDIIGYPYMTNQNVLVTIEAEDALSGVDRIVYKSVESDQIKEKTIQGNKVQFTISPRFVGKISAYAVDKMGNISSVRVSDGLIEEIKKPIITIDSNTELSKWQNTDIVCNIGVQDSDSGIEKIIYEVNNSVIKTIDYSKERTLKKSNQQTITFSEESKDSNGDTLKVTAIDRTGNQRVITKKVYLDKTKPEVIIKGIKEKGYFNKNQQLDITIEEAIYQYATVDIDVERYVDGNKLPYSVPELVMSGNITSRSLKFEQDGTYIVTVKAADKAGNRSETVTKEFIIDKTAPVIQLSGAEHTYYANDVELNIAVQESNYENNNVDIQVVREHNGQVAKEKIKGWTSTGKNTLSQEKFTLDGNYTVKVSSVDRAGNKAKEQTVKFVIDQTAPAVAVEGITPYEVTSKEVNLKSLITENNIMQNGTKLEIRREDINGKTEIITSQYLETPEKESSHETSIKEEGKYDVVISSTDKARNTTKKEVHFIIDRTAPQIANLDEYNGKYLKSFLWNKDKNAVIRDLTTVESHIFLNGIEYDGNFLAEEDGKYVLEITAEDELHHKSKRTAEFIVDSTAPVIRAVMRSEDNEIITLNDTNTVYQTGRVEIDLADKEDQITGLFVNGEALSLEEEINQYQVPIEEKGIYNIQVQAVDLAGNESSFTAKIECTTKTEKALKTASAAGGAIVLSAVVIAAGVVVYKKKRKNSR